jgi:hypothetical protein
MTAWPSTTGRAVISSFGALLKGRYALASASRLHDSAAGAECRAEYLAETRKCARRFVMVAAVRVGLTHHYFR